VDAELVEYKEDKELLAKEYNNGQIGCNPEPLTTAKSQKTGASTKKDRFELPNIRGIHFLLHDHLDRGVSSSSTYDILAKNVAEFLRCQHVDLPIRFLNRGKL
jgi:hypothetical protein